MFESNEGAEQAMNAEEAFSLLQELTANTPEEMRRQRTHFRVSIKAGVVIRPASLREFMFAKLRGVTGDISEGGCSGMFSVPPQVGDVYRMEFDRAICNLPMLFARCVRCRLIREDAFEAGYSFFAPILLPDNLLAGQESTLL